MVSFASTRQPVHRKIMKSRKVLTLKLSWENTDFWVIFWVQSGLNVFWKLLAFRSSLHRSHTRKRGKSLQNLQESLIRTESLSLAISITSYMAIQLKFTRSVYQKHVTNTVKFFVLHIVVIHNFSYLSVYISVCVFSTYSIDTLSWQIHIEW